MLLYKLYGWNKVTIGTNKDYGVCSIKYTVCNHTDRNVHICFLFFWSGDSIMAVGTLYLFIEIFSTHHLKAFTIQKFIGIEKRALATAFLWIQW